MVDKAYIHKGLQRSVNSNYRYDLITLYLDQVIGNICTNYKLGSYRNTKKRLYCYSIGKKFKGINKHIYLLHFKYSCAQFHPKSYIKKVNIKTLHNKLKKMKK